MVYGKTSPLRTGSRFDSRLVEGWANFIFSSSLPAILLPRRLSYGINFYKRCVLMSQNKAQNSALRLLNATLMGKKLLASTAITLAGVVAASSSAYAVGLDETPTGGVVVGGQSTITYGQGTMTVDQTTDRSVINWNTFNIGQNAGATYNQPGANSLSVNRVTGADPSQILGTLRSNGKIMIIDPNGVFFSKTAVVDVGGIIATTGELDAMNQDQLMAGNKFQISNIGANPDAKIENAGSITAAQGGLVAFVAPWVSNSGFINAKLGSVTLAAGAKMTVDLAGDNLISIAVNDKLQKALVENSGTIDAQGGRVVMSANAAKGIVDEVINMSGVIKANSFSQKGGKIILGGGTSGVVKVSGKIEANGETGGGEIEVKGENIFVTESGELHADGVTCGNGGTINIVAQNGLIYGGLSTAKGGALWGNGGFVDTSGLEWFDIWGNVDASAPNGLAGSWLLDPRNLEIISGTGNNTNGTGTSGSPFAPNGGNIVLGFGAASRLQASVLNTALNTGTDVYITTIGSPNVTGQDGTITVKADISKTSATNSTLFMTAAGSIVQDAGKTINSSNSKLGVSLTAEKDITLNGTINSNGGDVTFNAKGTVPNAVIFPTGDVNIAGTINSNGGKVTATAAKNINTSGTVNTNGGNISLAANGTALLQGVTNISGLLNAQGGNIDIFSKNAFAGGAETVRTSGTGTITLNQNSVAIYNLQTAVDAIKNTGTGLNTINAGASVLWTETVNANHDNLLIKGAAGYGSTFAVGGFNVSATNVTIDGFNFAGLSSGVNVSGVNDSVINNKFSLMASGVTSTGSTGLDVKNNTFTGILGTAVALNGTTGAEVSGNTLTGSVGDAVTVTGGTGNAVSGNSFLGSL